MMKKVFNGLLGIAVLSLLTASPAAARGGNALSVGAGGSVGPDYSATTVFVGYERLLGDRLSLGVMIGTIDYEYDDGVYWEEGDGPGIQFDLKIYGSGKGLRGFYWGGGFGVWETDWESIDDMGTPWAFYESGSTTSVDLHFLVGGKIHFGNSGIYLDPCLQVGSWLNANEGGPYVLANAFLGVAF